jgi:hypothetical protein
MNKRNDLKATTAVVPAEPQAGVSLPADTAGLARYAASDGGNYCGDLLKLNGKNGTYTYGAQGTELPEGTHVAVLLDQAKAGFIKWDAGQIESQAWARIADGPDLKAMRASLGDNDASEWEETTLAGTPKDPFQESVLIPMVVMDGGKLLGKLFTFTSSARGAVRATKKLIATLLIHVRATELADRVPVVELGVRSYQHPSRTVGTVFEPTFEVDNWVPARDVLHALGKAGNAAPLGVSNREALNADLGDEPDGAEPEPATAKRRAKAGRFT